MNDASFDKAEAIRIAPLHTGKSNIVLSDLKFKKGDEHLFASGISSSSPKLIYNGGNLIENVEVYTIFWGKNWGTTAAYKTLALNINTFFTAILISPLIDQLAEYNTTIPKYTIGHGTLSGTKTIVTHAPASGKSVNDSAIQKALQTWITTGTVAPVTPFPVL